MADSNFRGRVYDSIVETIGATPLVRLKRLAAAHQVKADLMAKCEFFNPLSSVKDRILDPIRIASSGSTFQETGRVCIPPLGKLLEHLLPKALALRFDARF